MELGHKNIQKSIDTDLDKSLEELSKDNKSKAKVNQKKCCL
jgi:hypothetical protein